jgi:iron complex outermembrane receptor protein
MKKLLLSFSLIMSVCSYAQHKVTGVVTDNTGNSLVGANIIEKGTNNGTISDKNGAYTIDCSSANTSLNYSFVGYSDQNTDVNGRSIINISLKEGMFLESVEIVGTRSPNRTVTESPVAIDVINISEIANSVGQVDINQLLQYAAPSFNSNKQSGADGADHVDPATLRGLGPDQTLVLVNGKRRHQSAHINIFGSRGRGNTGTDLNTIPASAIERIEILRDGASAQYGSDAIAGVINIVLKSSVNEFSGSVMMGAYNATPPSDIQDYIDPAYDAALDGEKMHLSGNYGVEIGDGGFLNMTIDYLKNAHTNRPSNPGHEDYAGLIWRRQIGLASGDNLATYFNAQIPLSKNANLYAFGGSNHRDTEAYAWTREADDDRNVPAIYPNGFDPRIKSIIGDKSFAIGVKSVLNGWNIDLNNTFGANTFHYMIDGTLNASLGASSPTSFDAGGYGLSQNTTSITSSKYFEDVMSGLNVAVGAEHRTERYNIFAGEEGSWKNYGVVDSVIDGIVTPVDVAELAAGSQGFPGFQPSNELDEYRSNISLYIDTELDINERLMVATALRAENYSDFGKTLNYKVASRYEITENIAARGSFSTGFRAPSLAQVHFNTTFTDFVGGTAVDKIIASNNSPLTRALGIEPLKEEEATNMSIGLTAKQGSFSATVDFYSVDIKDRVVLTGAFGDDDPEIGAELQALNIGAAQFFSNAIDTKTQGVDIVVSYADMFGKHRIGASLAANFNSMELGDVHTSDKLAGKEDIYFGDREKSFLLASAPNSKINLTLDYKYEKFKAMLRFVRFDQVELLNWDFYFEDVLVEGDEGYDAYKDLVTDNYDSRITADLNLSYDVSDKLTVNIGGTNILNKYPTMQHPVATETGGIWDSVQMGFSGAFYYSKLAFKF